MRTKHGVVRRRGDACSTWWCRTRIGNGGHSHGIFARAIPVAGNRCPLRDRHADGVETTVVGLRIGRCPARVEPGKFGVDVDGDGAERADLVRLPPRQQGPDGWVGIDRRSVRTESVLVADD
jgi:hypothetical protein